MKEFFVLFDDNFQGCIQFLIITIFQMVSGVKTVGMKK